MPAFDKCVGGEAAEKINSDIALAEQLDVTGTPTWFIGTVEPNGTVKLIDRITGVGPADMYGKAIDRVARSR
jgi:protein-disulfide isomerase